MPAYRHDGATFVPMIAHVYDGAAWSEFSDELRAHDGAAFRLIQPFGAGPPASVLLPVTALAADPAETSVALSWANPVPDIVPTEVWVRLPAISLVWDVFTYPITAAGHGALIAATNYDAEVRLVRRVAGVVTDSSTTSTVNFTTDASTAPGPPSPGPGGGGNTIIPLPGIPGTPGAVGSGGCWWKWTVQILDGAAWVDTLMTGQTDGDADPIDLPIDMTALDSSRQYRVKLIESCNGVDGAPSYGPPFFGPDWDDPCTVIDESADLGLPSFGDVEWYLFGICTDGAIHEALSDTPFDLGAGYNTIGVRQGTWGVRSLLDYDGMSWRSVAKGEVVALDTMLPGDATFGFAVDLGTQPVANTPLLVLGGGALTFYAEPSGAGYLVRARSLLTSGPVDLVGTTECALNATYRVILTWDDDGDKVLYVNGNTEDTDSSGDGYGLGSIGEGVTINLPEDSYMGGVAGWSRVLITTEVDEGTPTDHDWLIIDGATQNMNVKAGDILVAMVTARDLGVPVLPAGPSAGGTATIGAWLVLSASTPWDNFGVSRGQSLLATATVLTDGVLGISRTHPGERDLVVRVRGHSGVGLVAMFADAAGVTATPAAALSGAVLGFVCASAAPADVAKRNFTTATGLAVAAEYAVVPPVVNTYRWSVFGLESDAPTGGVSGTVDMDQTSGGWIAYAVSLS